MYRTRFRVNGKATPKVNRSKLGICFNISSIATAYYTFGLVLLLGCYLTLPYQSLVSLEQRRL